MCKKQHRKISNKKNKKKTIYNMKKIDIYVLLIMLFFKIIYFDYHYFS